MIPAELVRVVRQLEITTRGLVRSLAAGDYASVFRGRGVEFAEVREYMRGRRHSHDRLERHGATRRPLREAVS